MHKVFFTFCVALIATATMALTPDETAVNAVITEIEKAASEGRLFSAINESLPPKQQQGVFDMTQACAKKMNPTVWKSISPALNEIGKILETKSIYVVSSSVVQSHMADVTAGKYLTKNNCAAVGSAIRKGSTISLDQICVQREPKELAAFLDSQIGALPIERTIKHKVFTDSNNDIFVCYSHDASNTSCNKCLKFTKVEGKWIPHDLARTNFEEKIAKINEKLDFESEKGKQYVEQAEFFIPMAVELWLKPFLSVNSQEEFDETFINIFSSL